MFLLTSGQPSDLRALHNWGISCTLHAVGLLAAPAPRPPDVEGRIGEKMLICLFLVLRCLICSPSKHFVSSCDCQVSHVHQHQFSRQVFVGWLFVVRSFSKVVCVQDWVALYLWGNTLLSEFGAQHKNKVFPFSFSVSFRFHLDWFHPQTYR